MPKQVSIELFAKPTLEVAPRLIGMVMEANGVSGRIVEVEAYTDDPASHAFRRTSRSAIMYDTYGSVYVYLIYGANHCLNFTTDRSSVGAVLIRAVEPLSGMSLMQARRGVEDIRLLANGPGKLCRAFDLDLSYNGSKIGEQIRLFHGKAKGITTGPRIGITKATELPWRFWEEGNGYISRK
ncbi:MAG TPA: DNA-3-methyladenine glycosylase [bacterium]